MAGRILITGASGFLGRHLVAHLAATTGAELIAVSRGGAEVPGARSVPCDLSAIGQALRLLERERPDAIYHLAGAARVSDQIPFAEYFARNALATLRLVRAVAQATPTACFLLASSVHVYGNATGRVTEETSCRPTNAYGFTKFLAERALEAYGKEQPRARLVVARLDACVGPGQGPGFATADFSRKVAAAPPRGGRVEVGDLSARRRLLDARDAVTVLPQLLERARRPFDVFNVAASREVRLGEVLEAFIRIAGKSPEVKSLPGLHGNRFSGLDLSLDKLQAAVGCLRSRPMEETLRDIYAEATASAGRTQSA